MQAPSDTDSVINRRQTALGLIGYLFIGTATILLPSVMPAITNEFVANGLSLATIGLIFPAGAIGGIIGNVLSGIGSDVIGRRRLVWLSALLLAIALGLTAVTDAWLLFVIGYVLVSAASGSLSTGINAMIADTNRNSRAWALNILHGVYGVGAAISPLIIGWLLAGGLPWRWALGGVGLIWLIYGVVARLLYRIAAEDTAPEVAKGTQARKWDFRMLRERPFLALFAMGFIYNGVAVSLLGWIALITRQSTGFSTLVSVSMVSVFYVALTIGRFLCAVYAERLGYARTLLVLAWVITLSYPVVVFGLESLWIVVGVFLIGLGFSGLFPIILAYGARLYPDQSGTVSGTLSVALTIGSMIPPLWTGVIAELWGFQAALGSNFLLVLPLIFLALYLGRIEVRLSA